MSSELKTVNSPTYPVDELAALYEDKGGELAKYANKKIRGVDPAFEPLDAVHDVFVRTLAASSSGSSINNPKAYVFTTAKSVFTDALRKKGRRSNHVDIGEFEEYIPETDYTSLIPSADAMDLFAALKKLARRNEYQATILQLYFYQGYKQGEIAEMFGVTEAAIKIAQHRAIEALRELLSNVPPGQDPKKGQNHTKLQK